MKTTRFITFFSRADTGVFFQRARRVFVNDALTILVSPRTGLVARILIVANRASGNSVQRHKLRRRLREIFYQEKLYERLAVDVAIIVRKGAMAYSFGELRENLLKVLALFGGEGASPAKPQV